MKLKVSVLLTAFLLLGACTSDDSDQTLTDTFESSVDPDSETIDNSKIDGGDVEDSDPDANTQSSTESGSAASQGTEFDIGPMAGSEIDIVGVEWDDVLNFRDDADASANIVATKAPLVGAPSVISQGSGVFFTGSAWWKVEIAGNNAWANNAFLGTLGNSQAITQDLVDAGIETEPSLEELVEAIAAARTENPSPVIAYVTEPTATDAIGGQQTIDILGYQDDAQLGERIVINYEFEKDASGAPTGSLTNITAQSTIICGRGATSSGACI